VYSRIVVVVVQPQLGAGLAAPGLGLPGVIPAASALPATGFAPPGVAIPQLAAPVAATALPGVVMPQLTIPQPGIVTPQLAGNVSFFVLIMLLLILCIISVPLL